MMPALKIPECNSTTGPIGGKAPVIEAPSIQVLSSSFEGDDYGFGYEPALHDTSKFFHMTDEKMQVASPEKELPLSETATTEAILSIAPVPFLFDHVNIVLIPARMLIAEAATTTEGVTFSSILR